MPRTFTPHELLHGVTTSQYHAMPEDDKLAFDIALVALWRINAQRADALYLSRDYGSSPFNLRSDDGV
jgi:hypothetical protein